jgi:predicted lipoprotein with Yx(FWY)xxD motif
MLSIGGSSARAQTVFIVPDGGTGVMLTDPDGWTLYTWLGDRPGTSNCFGACADAWPPFTTTAELEAPFGFPGGLGIVDRGEGGLQVTMDGWPLYYFAGDGSPGDTKGNEIVGFGAPWQVAVYPPRTPLQDYGSSQNRQPDGPSPSFSAPPPAAGVVPTQIPYISPFSGDRRPQAPPSPPQQGSSVIVVPAGYAETVTVIAPASGIANLNWVWSPSAVEYRIYSTPSSASGTFSLGQRVAQPGNQRITSGQIGNLTPGVTYTIQVRAADASGIETTTPFAQVGSTLGR